MGDAFSRCRKRLLKRSFFYTHRKGRERGGGKKREGERSLNKNREIPFGQGTVGWVGTSEYFGGRAE